MVTSVPPGDEGTQGMAWPPPPGCEDAALKCGRVACVSVRLRTVGVTLRCGAMDGV